MPEISDRKLYLGPRLRVLRRELGVNQTQMAQELGVSPSYLNHLERNQRPLTAQMLLRLAHTYDIDVRDFVSGRDGSMGDELDGAFADPLVRDIGVQRHEIREIVENYPAVAEAIGRFHRAVADLRRVPDALAKAEGRPSVVSPPLDWLRDLLQQRRNHLPELDAAAERLSAKLGEDPDTLFAGLRQHLADAHRVELRIEPATALEGALRHYDFHRRRLRLAEMLPAPARLFALAYQVSVLDFCTLIDAELEQAAPPDADAKALLRVALANYAAAALIMPYGRFHEAALASRFDLPLLMARFGVSFEQAAHRLTSLERQGARGIPFFLIKIDTAGQIPKRVTAESYPFARHGGICPRWNLHRAFRSPGELVVDVVETLDERRFLILTRANVAGEDRPTRSPRAIAIGCEVRHADRICHADTNLRTPPVGIGPGCHVCERVACPDRALPPITRPLDMHQFQRGRSPYPFRMA